MKSADRQEGFALVEAVVALGIIALIFGVTFQTITRAQNTASDTEARRMAMLEARSVLAQVGATIPVVPGVTQGTSAAWSWRVEIAPYAGEGQQNIAISKVTVSVADRDAHDLARLETLRLVR